MASCNEQDDKLIKKFIPTDDRCSSMKAGGQFDVGL